MPRGQRRTVSPKPYILEKLGMQMVEWVKANMPLHLSEWYLLETDFTEEEFRLFVKKPEFKRYYDQARAIIGKQYLDGTVATPIALRWQRVYFRDLRDEEDQTNEIKAKVQLEVQKALMEHGAKLQSQAVDQVTEESKEALERLMEHIKSLQSDLKIDLNR
jgi:hypothetical protein